MKHSVNHLYSTKRFFSILLLTLIFLWTGSISIHATRFNVDPKTEPSVTLPAVEAKQLRALLSAKTIYLQSEISFDDRVVLVFIPSTRQLFFKDLKTLKITPVTKEIFDYEWLTDFRWISPASIVTIGMGKDNIQRKITITRQTGAMKVTPLEISGAVLSLATRGNKLLMARPIDEESTSTQKESRQSIIEMKPLYPGFNKREDSENVPVALKQLELVVVNLKSGKEKLLMEISADVAIMSIAWSPEDKRLAIVRGKVPSFARGGVITLESPEVQDALGLYPPEDNPFVFTNALDIFKLGKKKVRHEEIQPDLDDGEIFNGVVWAPSGEYLMAQTSEPSILSGRTYPTYCNLSASNYRFYEVDGECFHQLKRPEINAIRSDSYMFLSPFKVLLRVPDKLTYRLYVYNLKTEALKCLPTPEGMISQIQSFRSKSKLIYGFNSFEQPPELFTIKSNCGTIEQVTKINTSTKDANRIRLDKLQFTLSNGAKREGYLIQPENAPFPPANVPICVWQNGGPTATMTNRWSGNIEDAHNLLPNFGIATLMVPLPGRIGFGKAFLNALVDDLNFGQIDIDEQMEISKQLIQNGYTSSDRIGMYGMSYGGYFTSQTITTYPDFYAAANNQFSLINLFHEWEAGYMGYLSYLMGCIPENYEEYYKDSPLQRAKNVTIPTLVYTSSNDFLPAEFSLQFHDEINATGNTVSDVYYFENEGHGLRHFNNQFVAAQTQIEWFRRYLAQ